MANHWQLLLLHPIRPQLVNSNRRHSCYPQQLLYHGCLSAFHAVSSLVAGCSAEYYGDGSSLAAVASVAIERLVLLAALPRMLRMDHVGQ